MYLFQFSHIHCTNTNVTIRKAHFSRYLAIYLYIANYYYLRFNIYVIYFH